MKQKSVSVGIIVLNLIFSLFILYSVVNFVWLFCCLNYSNSIYLPDNYEIMRIKIYGSSDFSSNETVSANISILNTDEVECAVIERSWSGTSIAIDCFSFNNKFFFPKKIYGTNYDSDNEKFHSGRKGSLLTPYYLENNKCLLLGFGYSNKQMENLHSIVKYSFSNFSSILGVFTKKVIIDLSHCETGQIYSVIVNPNGNITLVEN